MKTKSSKTSILVKAAETALKMAMQLVVAETNEALDVEGATPSGILGLLDVFLQKTSSSRSSSCFSLTSHVHSTGARRAVAPTADITSWLNVTYDQIKADERLQKSQGLLREGETEKCTICLCEFELGDEGGIVRLSRCTGHFFHRDCIELCREDNEFLRCPVCSVIYGVMTGDMPPGTMGVALYLPNMMVCEGYERFSTIEISYSFSSGKTPSRVNYKGTSRIAYLPDTPEGREVLSLLMVAFSRRLTFTVGTSVTTGQTNLVVWNGVHHKTSLNGGTSCYGFPDATYFSRVKEELAAKGVLLA
jgi:deltex-like protein